MLPARSVVRTQILTHCLLGNMETGASQLANILLPADSNAGWLSQRCAGPLSHWLKRSDYAHCCPILHSVAMSCWQPGISHGGSIYTMEIGTHCRLVAPLPHKSVYLQTTSSSTFWLSWGNMKCQGILPLSQNKSKKHPSKQVNFKARIFSEILAQDIIRARFQIFAGRQESLCPLPFLPVFADSSITVSNIFKTPPRCQILLFLSEPPRHSKGGLCRTTPDQRRYRDSIVLLTHTQPKGTSDEQMSLGSGHVGYKTCQTGQHFHDAIC